MNIKNLLADSQSGFRQNRSTTTALLNVTEDIRIGLNKNNASVLVLLDFSKAFDSVNHNILISKLNISYDISPSACKLFNSYLTERSQFVNQHQDKSQLSLVRCGVPQGSVLGPLLFSIYINDLPNVIQHSTCNLYADDVQLLISGPTKSGNDLIHKLNSDLASIHNWSVQNELILNPKKSQYMIITLRNNSEISQWPQVIINQLVVQRVTSAKNLGVWFDHRFNWSDHVTKLCGKAYGLLRRLWKVAWALPYNTRARLIRSLVIPIIDYASPVFSNLSKTHMRKLVKVFNSCTRFAFGLTRQQGTSAYSHGILGCKLEVHFDVTICQMMHKLVKTGLPKYLADRLNYSVSQRTQRLNAPSNRLCRLNGMFFVKGVRLWNFLPTIIRNIQKPIPFRVACLEFLSANPFHDYS